MSRAIIFLLIFLAIDIYAYQVIQAAFKKKKKLRKLAGVIYWATIAFTAGIMLLLALKGEVIPRVLRSYLLTGIFAIYVFKIFVQ